MMLCMVKSRPNTNISWYPLRASHLRLWEDYIVICGRVRTPDRCGSPFGGALCHGGEGTTARGWANWLLPLQSGNREKKWKVSLTFSLCLGYQSVVEPHPYFWMGRPISAHLEKSLVDLLEVCLLGDSRSWEEDNVNHQRGKGIQLLWLEVGWADMEEGQGVRSEAVRSLPLLHSCHSKPSGDGFSYLFRLCKREGGSPQITIQAYSPPLSTEPATFTWSMDD